MLMIRLQRIGRKHEPVFRLVLTDSKNSTKSGKFLEILGNYDARRGEKAEFKAESIKEWMSKGAQLSDTVHNLLIDKKIISGKKINTLPLKKAPVKEVPAVEEVKPEPVVESAPAPVAEDVKEAVEEAVVAEESAPVAETPAEEVVA
jgi:small subunit ribosomal protein S16